MFTPDLLLPSAPRDAVRETNVETLHRLGHDLAMIEKGELTALDVYRLYLPVDGQRSWGYGLEAARVGTTNKVLVLFRNDEEEGILRSLR